jgi:PAS domain S-box-containing protein
MEKKHIDILIIEDSPADFKLAELMLKESLVPSFGIRHAVRLAEALKVLETEPCDIVLMDLELPDSFGLDGLKKIADRPVSPPVVVLTGLEDEAMGLEALKKGASDFLVKGRLTLNSLIRSLLYALTRREMEQRLLDEQHNLQSIFDAANVGMILIDETGAVQRTNRVIQQWIGKETASACGDQPGNILGCIHALNDPAGCGHTLRCQACPMRKAFEGVLNSGQPRHDIEMEMTIMIDRDQAHLHLAVSADPLVLNGKRHVILAMNNITDSKRTERALHESEARLSFALRTIHTGAWDIDLTDLTAQRTPEHDRIFGYDTLLPHWTYEMFLEHVLPEDRAEVDRKFRETMRTESDWNLECRIRRSDGEMRWILAAGRHRKDEKDHMRMSGIVQDITERKQIEEALRVSEERFRTMVNAMPQLAWIARPDGHLFWYNQRWYQYTGTTPEQMEGWGWQRVHHPVELPKVLESWKASLATGKPFEMTFPLRGADGIFRPFLTRGYPLKDEAGRVVQWLGTNTDVSELKSAEEELKKLNRILKALSASDQAMTRSTDESEYLTEVCRIIAEECGHPLVWVGYAEQDEAKTVRPVAFYGFDQGYIDSLKVTWADTERGRGPTGIAVRTGKMYLCRDVKDDPAFAPWKEMALERGFRSSLVLPLDENNGVMGALNIYAKESDAFSDEEIKLLTRLASDLAHGVSTMRLRNLHKQAEEVLKRDKETFERIAQERTEELLEAQLKLTQSKRLSDIGALAATVAHELRTPLGVIRIGAYNMKRKTEDPALLKHISHIETKVMEADKIISNLLLYSRIKMPTLEAVRLYDLLKECVDHAEENLKGHSIRIVSQFEPINNESMKLDPLQVKEVFHNILANAADALAHRKDGQIKVSALRRGLQGEISIAFEDNGVGISESDLKRIHEPFFTTKSKGTGLGLTVCTQIIQNHGGRIKVSSQLGQGSVFTVILPAEEGTVG